MAIDKEYIDVDGALRRIGGNKGLYAKLLAQFLEGDSVGLLEKALAEGDREKAIREAHSIKGTGANLSLSRLSAAALEIEKKIKVGDDTADSLAELKEVFNVTREQIELVTSEL